MAVVIKIDDRRRHQRLTCKLKASEKQTISNVSRKGFYLESEKEYPLQSEIPISFHLPHQKEPIQISAEVVRKEVLGPQNYGYGLKAKGLAEKQYQNLKQYSLQEPLSVEREKEAHRGTKVHYETIKIKCRADILDDRSCFDLTKEVRDIVRMSGITQGSILIQTIDPSTRLMVDSKERDLSFSLGQVSILLIVRGGELACDERQKIILLDSEVLKEKEILIQVMGI